MSAASQGATDDPLTARIETLVAHFAEISETQMKDLPIYNHALVVEAIGFRPFCARYVGVLITPWFINLISLPRTLQPQTIDSGDGQETVDLPGGPQIFLRSFDPAIGEFSSKSLLSALFHLHSQQAARIEASDYLSEAMTPTIAANGTGISGRAHNVSRRDFFRGRVK